MGVKSERAVIEHTYTDICGIYEFKKNKSDGITSLERQAVIENVPCALSQKSLNTTHQTNAENKISYDAKLFLQPDIIIAPGSHIEVMRQSRLYKFISAGEAFVYPTHQEIMLLNVDKA